MPYTIAIRPEERDDQSPPMRAGFDAFAAGVPAYRAPALSPLEAEQWRAGWFAAWARCFAEGVKASVLDGMAGREGVSPYPQFSGQWEAWAEGYDSESTLPGPPWTVRIQCDEYEPTDLASFLADNADGIDEEMASAIRVTLADGRPYVGDDFTLKPLADPHRPALERAESFIAGFEDDESQAGIATLLADMRAALGRTA